MWRRCCNHGEAINKEGSGGGEQNTKRNKFMNIMRSEKFGPGLPQNFVGHQKYWRQPFLILDEENFQKVVLRWKKKKTKSIEKNVGANVFLSRIF